MYGEYAFSCIMLFRCLEYAIMYGDNNYHFADSITVCETDSNYRIDYNEKL